MDTKKKTDKSETMNKTYMCNRCKHSGFCAFTKQSLYDGGQPKVETMLKFMSHLGMPSLTLTEMQNIDWLGTLYTICESGQIKSNETMPREVMESRMKDLFGNGLYAVVPHIRNETPTKTGDVIKKYNEDMAIKCQSKKL